MNSAVAIAETINVTITSHRKFRASNAPLEMKWTCGREGTAEKAGKRRTLTLVIWGQSPETNAVAFIFLQSETNR